jgi:hypothetical protein
VGCTRTPRACSWPAGCEFVPACAARRWRAPRRPGRVWGQLDRDVSACQFRISADCARRTRLVQKNFERQRHFASERRVGQSTPPAGAREKSVGSETDNRAGRDEAFRDAHAASLKADRSTMFTDMRAGTTALALAQAHLVERRVDESMEGAGCRFLAIQAPSALGAHWGSVPTDLGEHIDVL